MATAVVTGASSGLGAACVRRLAADGLSVIGVDVHPPPRAEADGGRDVHDQWFQVDVTDAAAVASIADQVACVDVLVNSAGIVGPNQPLWSISDNDWRRTFEVNVTGTFHMCRQFVPGMIEAGWGRVVNLASIAGKDGNPNLSAYSASKAAVIAMTKSLGKELATTGVLVNAVAPAVFSTPMNAETAPEVLDRLTKLIPMERLGKPHELASLVSWLASDECTFSTGAVYDISGGRATY